MRIAICDDEKSEIIKIQNTIAELQGNYQVDTYQNGKALLEAVRKGVIYDIFLRYLSG